MQDQDPWLPVSALFTFWEPMVNKECTRISLKNGNHDKAAGEKTEQQYHFLEFNDATKPETTLLF